MVVFEWVKILRPAWPWRVRLDIGRGTNKNQNADDWHIITPSVARRRLSDRSLAEPSTCRWVCASSILLDS